MNVESFDLDKYGNRDLYISANRGSIRIAAIVVLIFLISPVVAIPLVLIEIYNKKKYAIALFILFLSLLAYLFPPTGDLYRYYDLYYLNFGGISYISIFDYYIFDVLWYSVLYILANLNLSFQFSIFISALVQSYITIWFLNRFNVLDVKISFKRFALITVSLLYLGFWGTIESRYSVALSFFLLEVYALVEKKYKMFGVFLLLSSLCHLSFVFFSIIVLLGYILKKYLSLTTSIFIAVLGNVIVIALGWYLDSLGFAKAVYVVEQTDWTEGLSPILLFFKNVVKFSPYFVLGIFVIFRRSNSEYRKYALLFLALSIATLSFPDLNERIRTISSALMWLYLMSIFEKVPKSFLGAFIVSGLIAFMANSAIANRSLRIGNYEKLFLPYVSTMVDGGYSQQWIESRISDGDVVNIK